MKKNNQLNIGSKKQILFFLISFIISFSSLAQEKWDAIKVDTTKFSVEETTYAYPIQEEGLSERYILMINPYKIWLNVKDANQLANTFVGNVNTNAYEKLLGHWFDKKNIYLLFSSKSRERFLKVTISKKDFIFTSAEVTLIPLQEKYFASVSVNNSFILFTVEENSSIVRLYKVDDNLFTLLKKFDLGQEPIVEKINFYNLLTGVQNNTVQIDNNIPTPLVMAGKRNKMYQNKEQVIFTMNGVPERGTIVWNLNLKNLTYTLNTFSLSKDIPVLGIRVASFLMGDTLAQLEVGTDKMGLWFYNIKSGIAAKKYVFGKNEIIPIKYDDNIIKLSKNNNIESVELKRTMSLFRNMNSNLNDPAVSLFKNEEGLNLWVGSFRNEKYYLSKQISANVEGEQKSSGTGAGNGSGGGKGGGGGNKSKGNNSGGGNNGVKKEDLQDGEGKQAGGGKGNGSGGGLNKIQEASAKLNGTIGFRNYSYLSVAKPLYFKAILNNKTLANDTSTVPSELIVEKMKRYEKDSKLNMAAKTVFLTTKKQMLLGYFDKRNAEYTLLKFE